MCDGIVPGDNVELAAKCGRPIGLEFDQKTGDLYVIDAFHGPMVVGPKGGIATPLTSMDGVPVDVPDAIDVDPVTGTVFYTDIGPGILKIKYMSIRNYFAFSLYSPLGTNGMEKWRKKYISYRSFITYS